MTELSEHDVHRALHIVATAAAGGNGTAFGLETVDAIAAAIPADDVAYVEWRFGDPDVIRVGPHPESPRGLTTHWPPRAIRTRSAILTTPAHRSR